jgi:c-di-GMP-binding flagellar brake protein YcgR
VFQERRKTLRRQSDRELLQQVQYLRERRSGHTEEDKQRRRRAIRHHCAVSLSIRVGYSSGTNSAYEYNEQQVKGRVLDLSPTGCAVFARQALPNGSDVGLQIHLDNRGDIAARGVVRWTKGVDAREGFACGIEFTKLQPRERDQIAMFLRDIDENIGL